VVTREIFVGYFEENFGEKIDHYIFFVDQLRNKHFENKFKIHFEFRASLRNFVDLNFRVLQPPSPTPLASRYGGVRDPAGQPHLGPGAASTRHQYGHR
jgi:hypothetical protein